VGADAFSGVADGAAAIVTSEELASYSNWYGLTLSAFSQLEGQLAQITAERDAAIAERDAVVVERDARPTQVAYNAAVATARTAGQGDVTTDPANYNLVTQASYDAVVAERDARFTEDQIHAMSADYTMGLNEAGNVEIKIFFIESADLQTFTPFTVDPETVSVVDGKICLEFASEDRAFFFRFRVE
jgi:hypothetical protein